MNIFKTQRVGTVIFVLALLAFLSSWNRADFLEELQSKFDRYTKDNPSVLINLEFNQPYYSPGDTALFSAWYVDEALQPVKGNHIITVDILSGTGEVYQRVKLKVQNGRGFNQIALKKTIPAGQVKIIAYTDWMKNFSTTLFFQKSLKLTSKKEAVVKSLKKETAVKFFPEGGHFINGITGKLAITGDPNTELVVKDKQNTEVLRTKLNATGFGSITLTPLKGEIYTATDSKGKTWSTPSVEEDGISIKFDPETTEEISFSIPSKSKWNKREVFAIVTSGGKIVLKKEIELNDNKAVAIQIPVNKKRETLYQVYVLDAKGQVFGERIILPASKEEIHTRFQFPSAVNQREAVSGKISIQDESGNPLESDFSITIFQDQLFKKDSLRNSFKFIDLPALAEQNEKGQSKSTLNDFLITQKWSRIDWPAILGEKKILPIPFRNQIKLTGTVVSRENGQPAPDSTLIITYLQKNTIGYERPITKGRFDLPFVFDFDGEDEVFATLRYKSKSVDNKYRIIITEDTIRINDRWTSAETSEPSLYGEYAFNRNFVKQSFSFFSKNDNRKTAIDQNPNKTFEDEFFGTDFAIYTKDYLVFPKIEDLFKEIIPFIQVKKKGDEQSVRVIYRNETSVRAYKDTPLYIIDGVMTKDTEFLLSIKPENLVAIKVVNNPNKLVQLGKLGENGIVFIESKKGDLANLLSKENLFPVVGLSNAKLPLVIDYSDRLGNSRVPDLRSDLYWNPVVKASTGYADIKFSSSDDIGPMRIRVTGITKDGRSFSSEQLLNVNFEALKK